VTSALTLGASAALPGQGASTEIPTRLTLAQANARSEAGIRQTSTLILGAVARPGGQTDLGPTPRLVAAARVALGSQGEGLGVPILILPGVVLADTALTGQGALTSAPNLLVAARSTLTSFSTNAATPTRVMSAATAGAAEARLTETPVALRGAVAIGAAQAGLTGKPSILIPVAVAFEGQGASTMPAYLILAAGAPLPAASSLVATFMRDGSWGIMIVRASLAGAVRVAVQPAGGMTVKIS
jgi:hypothetical protein